jgi:hypothetical protein
VVDGPSTFPELYQKLEEFVGKNNGSIDEFVWVEWLKSDKRWRGQPDGAYANYRFAEVVRRTINTGKSLVN